MKIIGNTQFQITEDALAQIPGSGRSDKVRRLLKGARDACVLIRKIRQWKTHPPGFEELRYRLLFEEFRGWDRAGWMNGYQEGVKMIEEALFFDSFATTGTIPVNVRLAPEDRQFLGLDLVDKSSPADRRQRLHTFSQREALSLGWNFLHKEDLDIELTVPLCGWSEDFLRGADFCLLLFLDKEVDDAEEMRHAVHCCAGYF